MGEQPSDRADRRGGRLGRGWRLTMASWSLAWRDRTVLLLALIGGVCGVAALGAVLFVASDHFATHHSDHARLVTAALLASYPLTFLVVFFDVAMAAAAGARLEGGHIGVGEALRTAHRRGGRVAIWAAVAVGASLLLWLAGARLPDRLGAVILPLDLLWVLATIFVVPLLALEDLGVRDALRESGSLLRHSWGEDLTGIVAIGLWAVLMSLPALFVVLVGIASLVLSPNGAGLIAVGLGLLGLMAAKAVAGALQQVFAVTLYRYASGGSA